VYYLVVRITTSPVLDVIEGKKISLSVEEGIKLWKDISTQFEKEHAGFRVNFILCAVKRLGKSKI